MKEDDPTILDNQTSSPMRSRPTPDDMPSSRNGSGGPAWTPLKDESSMLSPRSSTVAPSSPADSDIDYGMTMMMTSPMQHLMAADANNIKGSRRSGGKILRSDDEDNPNGDGNGQYNYAEDVDRMRESDKGGSSKQRRTRAMVYVLGGVILTLVVAAVITAVLLLMDPTSNQTSSESSSSTTNDPPVTVVVTTTPVAPTTMMVPTRNSSSYVPSSVPSVQNLINGTTMTPTMNKDNSTSDTPTMSPVFVTSPTVSVAPTTSTNTNGTTNSTTIAPTPTLVATLTPVVVNTTNTPTVTPVSSGMSDGNDAIILPVLQSFLLPDDLNAITSDDSTSVYVQSYQYMISSDTYLASSSSGSSSSSSSFTDLQIFQRYILIVLNSLLPQSSSSSSSTAIRVNPAGDHCTWIGIACNTNNTDSITDGVVTDLVWTELRLQGTIPSTIQYLSSLTKLDLGTNELSGTIPEALYTNLTNLEHLYLHDNQLIGTLSNTGLALLSNLKHLFLNDNRLTGTLPQSLGSPGTNAASARPLEWLNLYNNSFTGRIPLNWNLRNVFLLDLGRNQLTGSIPADWIDHMFNLRILYLNHNRLSGSFPVNFPLIGNNRLWLLQVNDNQLTGVIPGGYNIRQMDLSEYQNNLFTSMDTLMCRNIVFVGGEMVSMRSDCGATCPCEFYCSADLCY
jgi:hypothetical protein